MDLALLKVEIRFEHDVVLARRRARQIAQLLEFDTQDQIRIATAVSELARNAFQYAGGGRAEFLIDAGTQGSLKIRVSDKGPGITNIDAIMAGDYQSKTGMGLGLVGAKRLADSFSIISTPGGGTTVEMSRTLSRKAPPVPELVAKIAGALTGEAPQNPFEEMQRQNQELLAALDEVERQKQRLTQLNLELEETNRGVMALSAELEQRADYQRRASEMKTEFLSTITHELRTPLNSMISISGMLLDRLDGELSAEQEKQIGFIQGSAKELSNLVNDVLDLAKVEAGKIAVRASLFEVDDMFRILRGMLRPLLRNDRPVELVFDDVPPGLALVTDEGKVSQILRNFISNSLKYTEAGEVRVSARPLDAKRVIFCVRDTGVGIAPEDHERIFEDFAQIEGDHQKAVRGTGLGLPLSRKLASLLGGEVTVDSALGQGSTFCVILPREYQGPDEVEYRSVMTENREAPRFERILIIDDQLTDRYILRKYVRAYADLIIEAASGTEALAVVRRARPTAVFLDLHLPDMPGEAVLQEIRKMPQSQDLPVIIHSGSDLSEADRARLTGDGMAIAIVSKSQSHSERRKQVDGIFRDLAVKAGGKKDLS